MTNTDLIITDSAAQRIQQQSACKQNPQLCLRVCVESGGCSGFKYIFTFEDAPLQGDDHLFEHAGTKCVIDTLSLSLIGGSELDYVETLGQAGFVIKNPAATARCGCGASFSL